MRSRIWLVTLAAWILGACGISISTPTPPGATPLFFTATLPSTKTPFASETAVTTQTAAAAAGTFPANCRDGAVLLQDVTIADGTNLAYGVKFTKTWQFRNTGTCPWSGYTIVFASGDRMQAPDAAPVAQTAPKATVDLSVDLVAPSTDGAYTGFFELRNSAGKPLAIGVERTFWVRITVGNATLPTLAAPTGAIPTITGTLTTPKGPLSCKYTVSPSYPGEIVQLINQARAGAGLAALNIDARLAAAAQNHSIDMACFSLLSHTGTNGSSIAQRITAAGYPSTYSLEMIYGGYGAYPQDAFNYWMNDPAHHAVIVDAQLRDIGAGFAYVVDSAQGDYYTVDLGSQ
jgi:uncharacterized protein YkwD